MTEISFNGGRFVSNREELNYEEVLNHFPCASIIRILTYNISRNQQDDKLLNALKETNADVQIITNVPSTIITNKHVVNHKQDENVKFHLHLREENGESNTSIGIKMNAHWYFHSTKDLCFTFVNPVFEGVKKAYGKDVFFIANDASIMATREKLQELSALEELVMVGYPIGLSDTRNNYPIFRKGYTSAHPAVDFNDDGIGLVDMACFPGSSGSPIFILNEGGYRDKRGNSYFGRSRILLLGILYAGPQYDARGEIVVKTIPTSKQVVESNTSIMTNLGYYIKAEELCEFQNFIEKGVLNGTIK